MADAEMSSSRRRAAQSLRQAAAAFLAPTPERAYIDRTKNRMFALGLLTGAALCLFMLSTCVMMAAYDPRTLAIYELARWSYPLFRGSFLVCFAGLCYGACMFVWRRKRIDFHRIFGMSPAIKYEVLLDASWSMAILIFLLFCYYMTALLFPDFSTPGYDAAPVCALGVPFVMLLWPSNRTPVFFHTHPKSLDARRFLILGLLGPVLAAPLTEPTFARCFLADVLCSMPKILSDLAYATCVAFSGLRKAVFFGKFNAGSFALSAPACKVRGLATALQILPFAARLSQSLRLIARDGHLKDKANAFKYFSALCLTGASIAKSRKKSGLDWATVWLALSIYCTCYNLIWDVRMDWGLPRRRRYFKNWIYVLAVLADAVLRMGWAIYVSPEQRIVEEHVVLVLGAAEIARRFMWAIFRIEHEQTKLDELRRDPDDSAALLDRPQTTAVPRA